MTEPNGKLYWLAFKVGDNGSVPTGRNHGKTPCAMGWSTSWIGSWLRFSLMT